MKKKLRVIQINGLRGLCFALAVACCLVAGFVVFPGYLAMNIWNFISAKTLLFPTLGLLQGTLLWGIVVVSYMIAKKRHFMVTFKNPTELTDEELDEVMERIKMETTAQMMTDVIANSRVSKKPVILDSQDINEGQEKNERIETDILKEKIDN